MFDTRLRFGHARYRAISRVVQRDGGGVLASFEGDIRRTSGRPPGRMPR